MVKHVARRTHTERYENRRKEGEEERRGHWGGREV
jgi:hypothetical protein